jgi:hypothetical protein
MFNREVHEKFWWGKLRERDHLEDLGEDWSIILKCILQNLYEEAWTGLI